MQAEDPTVLLVEDDEKVLQLLSMVLEREGYRVLRASSGPEAIRLCTPESGVRLVVTDVQMPEMSGPEMMERLRAAGCCAPGLFISAFPLQPRDAARELGLELLQKPFSPRKLVGKVQELLQGGRRKVGGQRRPD